MRNVIPDFPQVPVVKEHILDNLGHQPIQLNAVKRYILLECVFLGSGLTMQVAKSSMKSLKRNLHVTNILSAGYLTTPQMVNDVMRLQALVDRKKVIITEAIIREALRLDDAESIDCLPNEMIFTELSRMGMSAKTTSWNEFSSSMASAVICLSSECSSCGALYTTDNCCSDGSLIDKIICNLNKAPDSPHLHTFSSNQRHCFQCKNVLGDGEFCQRCTFMRCGSGLSKGRCLICGDNQNSLNDSPSISENSSQSPSHINHHCCYEYGDPLDGIFCHQCTCESCGKGAHYAYNCPLKVPIIPNLEPCNNQTIDELPQTLPSFDPTCYSGNESLFTCDSTPNIVDDSPNVFNPPPQPPKYSYEFCGNDAYYGYVPNGEALRKCILSGPYKPTTVLVQAVAATDDSLAIPEHTTVEKPMNMSPANKAYFEAEKEAIHLILTGIGDEIYSTVDACQTAQEMWEAIERLQEEWSRFMMIVKQQHKLDEVSYHKLFDILKQYQKEVNELRAERLARNANPLALVATAQANQDPYYQTSKSHKPYAPSSKPSIPTRTHTTTMYKGKDIAKPITPPSETSSEEDSDHEQAQRDKNMQKNLALIAKYFKKIYKPTNNKLRTSSNSRNKNVDTTLRYKNDNQSGQFGNQRMVNVARARENVGSPVVQQSGMQCFNCKEFGYFAKECRKPKRVKGFAYHKEKMLLCKQAEHGELEAHYSYIAKIQEVPTADSGTDSEPLEQVQNNVGYNVFANDLQHFEQSESTSNTCLVETHDNNVIPDSPDMCNDDIQNDQNDVESDDERVGLANIITNLKLDVDENKKIQKKLNKANTILAQELKECKTILAKTSKTLRESISVRDSCLVALHNKQTDFVHLMTVPLTMTNLNVS
nr:hypothetical protein [Tanacetum cinerariifolium]